MNVLQRKTECVFPQFKREDGAKKKRRRRRIEEGGGEKAKKNRGEEKKKKWRSRRRRRREGDRPPQNKAMLGHKETQRGKRGDEGRAVRAETVRLQSADRTAMTHRAPCRQLWRQHTAQHNSLHSTAALPACCDRPLGGGRASGQTKGL